MSNDLISANALARAEPTGMTLETAIKLASDYRAGKDRLHVALCAAVNQIGKGNPDWLSAVFAAAELVVKKTTITADKAEKTTYHVHGDGQVVWGYIRSFLNLGDIIRWDSAKGRFGMMKGWQDAASRIDVAELVRKMRAVRWDKWNSKPAEEVFDPVKAVERFIKKLNQHGFPPAETARMVAMAAKVA